MKEVGMLNGHIDSALTRQGHINLVMTEPLFCVFPDPASVL